MPSRRTSVFGIRGLLTAGHPQIWLADSGVVAKVSRKGPFLHDGLLYLHGKVLSALIFVGPLAAVPKAVPACLGFGPPSKRSLARCGINNGRTKIC